MWNVLLCCTCWFYIHSVSLESNTHTFPYTNTHPHTQSHQQLPTMAPARTEEETFEVPVSKNNGGKHTIDDSEAAAAAAPGAAKKGKYNAIPGPLGLASASLEGKVALVTGAGKFFFFFLALSFCLSCSPPIQMSCTAADYRVGDVRSGPRRRSLAP